MGCLKTAVEALQCTAVCGSSPVFPGIALVALDTCRRVSGVSPDDEIAGSISRWNGGAKLPKGQASMSTNCRDPAFCDDWRCGRIKLVKPTVSHVIDLYDVITDYKQNHFTDRASYTQYCYENIICHTF